MPIRTRPGPGGSQRARVKGQSGAATAELVLATPVLLLCLMLIVQFGLWYHGTHVAQAAAQEGARAARVEGGSAEAGQQKAYDLLNRLGRTVVVEPTVEASRDAESARVEVRGWGQSVIPGFSMAIREVSVGPVERFRGVNE